MLVSSQTWTEVLAQFVTWYQNNNLTPETATFATCGLWDFTTCLPGQCTYSGVAIPPMMDVSESGAFVNVKFSYQKYTGKYGKGITEMQKELGLEFDGKLHSGDFLCDKKYKQAERLRSRERRPDGLYGMRTCT